MNTLDALHINWYAIGVFESKIGYLSFSFQYNDLGDYWNFCFIKFYNMYNTLLIIWSNPYSVSGCALFMLATVVKNVDNSGLS